METLLSNGEHISFLKVKCASLAAEARIIRKEQARYRKGSPVYHGLVNHRKGIVRSEARDSYLAYGYLRGRRYAQLEQKATVSPNWKNVKRLVAKYGAIKSEKVDKLIDEWRTKE